MREILFRGKRIDNGEWVYGSRVIQSGEWLNKDEKATDEYWIYGKRGEIYLVDSSTAGQYTGLTDKNGKRIFEDDIIRANHDGAVGVVRFGEYMSPSDPDPTRHIGYYVDWQGKEKDFLRADLGYWTSRSDVEVIGNIHDNSELLEVNS